MNKEKIFHLVKDSEGFYKPISVNKKSYLVPCQPGHPAEFRQRNLVDYFESFPYYLLPLNDLNSLYAVLSKMEREKL
jgi:hypothetical protein